MEEVTQMNAEYIDIVTKLASLGTAVVGLIVAVSKAFYVRPDEALLNKVARSNLDEKGKEDVTNCIQGRRTPWIVLLIVCVLVVGFVIWNLVQTKDDKEVLSKSLKKSDGALFQYSRDGLFDIARVFPDKQSLDNESALKEVIQATSNEFNLFSDHGVSVLENYKSDLIEALRRGVKIRVILLHPSMIKDTKNEGMLSITKQDPESLLGKIRSSQNVIRDLKQQVASNKTEYPGRIDLRLLRKPIVYRMWLRDPTSKETAMAHISVFQYRGRMTLPNFRVTRKTSEKLLQKLNADFETVWKEAARSN
jgi:hypothetical protein